MNNYNGFGDPYSGHYGGGMYNSYGNNNVGGGAFDSLRTIMGTVDSLLKGKQILETLSIENYINRAKSTINSLLGRDKNTPSSVVIINIIKLGLIAFGAVEIHRTLKIPVEDPNKVRNVSMLRGVSCLGGALGLWYLGNNMKLKHIANLEKSGDMDTTKDSKNNPVDSPNLQELLADGKPDEHVVSSAIEDH